MINTKTGVLNPIQSLEFLSSDLWLIPKEWKSPFKSESGSQFGKPAKELYLQPHCSVWKCLSYYGWWCQHTQQSCQLAFITDTLREWEHSHYNMTKITRHKYERPEGVGLVDKWGSSTQWQTLVHHTVGPHGRNRCIPKGQSTFCQNDLGLLQSDCPWFHNI